MWPGLDSQTRRHMWVEFVVGSRPCSRVFSPGSPVFFPPQKPRLPNSNSIGISEGHRFVSRKTVKCYPSKTNLTYLFICLFIYLFIYSLVCHIPLVGQHLLVWSLPHSCATLDTF